MFEVSLIYGRHLLSYCHDLLGQKLFQVLGGLGQVTSLLVKVATILKYSRDISDKFSQTRLSRRPIKEKHITVNGSYVVATIIVRVFVCEEEARSFVATTCPF